MQSYDLFGNPSISPGCRLVLTSSEDSTAKLWDIKTGECKLSFVFALRQDCGHCRLWRTSAGKCIMTLQGHTERTMHAEFSFDGTLLLTAAQDNKARNSNSDSSSNINSNSSSLLPRLLDAQCGMLPTCRNYTTSATSEKTENYWQRILLVSREAILPSKAL